MEASSTVDAQPKESEHSAVAVNDVDTFEMEQVWL